MSRWHPNWNEIETEEGYALSLLLILRKREGTHSFSVIKYIMSEIVVRYACFQKHSSGRNSSLPLFASYSYLYSLVMIIRRVNEEFNVGYM